MTSAGWRARRSSETRVRTRTPTAAGSGSPQSPAATRSAGTDRPALSSSNASKERCLPFSTIGRPPTRARTGPRMPNSTAMRPTLPDGYDRIDRLSVPPLFAALEGARSVLIAGAGGGFDVYAGLPLAVALLDAGRRVHL